VNCLLCGEERPTEAAIRVKVANEIRDYAEVNYPPACAAKITALFLADRISRSR
jgi:hypothetical protein